MKENSDKIKYSGANKLLFKIILICIPFILLVLLEISLRVINYGDNFRLFINYPGKEIRAHKIINPKIGKKYFHKLEYSTPCHDMFLKDKPENGFRIFVLGSSTVLGFPYDENLMFTRILQERLQDSYPDKNIEVINTALTAINSFTLLDFIDEILDEKPDAILIYAGHNEFYGALGIGSVENSFLSRGLTNLHLELLNFRIYQLLRNLIGGAGGLLSKDKNDIGVRGTLMKVIANNKEIPYKSVIYNEGIERYQKNMDALIRKARRKNVPVFISDLVSNVKDLKPFCSITTSDFASSAQIYKDAVKCETEGDYIKAKNNYYKAKDLDCVRFRASEDINEIIHNLAKQYGAYLVPMKSSFFEQASPHNLIGDNLITEHLHPNIDGYFLMADAFFYTLAESKLLGDKLNIVNYKNSAYYQKNWGYTVLDSLLGVHRVDILKCYWPYQSFDSRNIDFRENYKPVSKADSLALDVLEMKIRTNEAHQKMAVSFKKNGDYYNASREYHAAIECNPYQLNDYFEIVNSLIKINDLVLALKFINKSLDLQESSNGYFIKAEILIMKGDYQEAIEALNKAGKLDNNHENIYLILQKLYEAYYFVENDNKKLETLNKLKEINPQYHAEFPEKKYEFFNYVPLQVELQIRNASDLYRAGKDDQALDILFKTIEIKETSIANRIIGDILFRRNDKNAILYYLKAYPDYKKDIGFLYDLGILYLNLGVKDKSKEILEEMKSLDSKDKRTVTIEEKLNLL